MTTPSIQPQRTQEQGNKVKIVAGYALQQRLGSGSFATVYRGVKVNSSEGKQDGAKVVAIKAIQRLSEKLTKKVLENLELEISILRTYRHPNIVCLHDVQKTERHFYLILEYCGGGDLQRLIRTRKTGRLTERLGRRLMRDLASGLRFLWSQELIHRDIKPQNLLLTGPLPLEELNDPAKMDIHEQMRQQANYPSAQFALKIADFGFARHLQTASLAETLCGSPLYMAPEILQHQRYDAKADLWSVGTVLFEMIAGKPPFNGENHIDLLRNIQRKAVRLPPDVKVSKECVNLLRILLNRNPLARAGFKEFMEASEAFVALGCEGQPLDATAAENQPSIRMDLGTIHETDQAARNAGSMATIATHQHIPTQKAPAQHHQLTAPPTRGPALVQPSFTTPPLGPATPPPNLVSPNDMRLSNARPTQMQPINSHLAPLQPSPPQFAPQRMNMRVENAPVMPPFDINALQRQRSITLATLPQSDPKSGQSSQHSSDGDSGFVMVERQKGDSPGSSGSYPQPSANSSSLIPSALSRARNSAPQSSNFLKASGRPRADYMMGSDGRSRSSARGMLSTSPGTGGALVGMFGLGRQRVIQNPGGNKVSVDTHIDNATKVVAAAEDVGRRAISVAHLGDNRACIAMRLVATMGTSSLLSAAPMEGVEEEDEDDEHSSANVTNDGSSDSTPVARRGRTVSLTDKSMTEAKDEVEEEEMPFALASESPANVPFAPLPSRNSSSDLKKSTLSTSKASAPPVKPTPELIRSRFGEALSCYLKALSMVKGVLAAVQKVKRDIDLTLAPSPLSGDQVKRINALAKRCEFTQNWLSGQFAGVLERADAANEEIGKLPSTAENRTAAQMGVKELIYNQALACGRDGAVKQLLGQYEASRSCYRSAGLLAETLLMENVGADDRKVLESYVDGFSTRITELDEILMEQSRSIASGGSTASGNRFAKRGSGSGVIGLIGGIQPPFLAYEPAVPPPV